MPITDLAVARIAALAVSRVTSCERAVGLAAERAWTLELQICRAPINSPEEALAVLDILQWYRAQGTEPSDDRIERALVNLAAYVRHGTSIIH